MFIGASCALKHAPKVPGAFITSTAAALFLRMRTDRAATYLDDASAHTTAEPCNFYASLDLWRCAARAGVRAQAARRVGAVDDSAALGTTWAPYQPHQILHVR